MVSPGFSISSKSAGPKDRCDLWTAFLRLHSKTSFDGFARGTAMRISDSHLLKLNGSSVWSRLRAPACAAVLDALLMESFLSRSQDGHFVRSPIVV